MKPWSGRSLRFVSMPFEPFNIFYIDPVTKQQRVYGLMGSMVGNVSASLNMTYTVVSPLDGEYGMVIEDTNEITGMPKTIMDGAGDITGPFPRNYLLSENLHAAESIHDFYTQFSVITGMKQQYVTTPTSFTDAFDTPTWLYLSFTFAAIVLIAMTYSILWNRRKSMSIIDSFIDPFFSYFAVILQEATAEKPPKRWFERFIRALWLIPCMFISYLFLGAMKANLIVMEPTLRVDSIPELLDHRELTLYYGANTPCETLLEEMTGEIGDRMREHISVNSGIVPFHYLHSQHVRDRLAERRGAVLMEDKFMRMGISRWCVESPYSFYIAKEPITFMSMNALLNKNLPQQLIKDFDMQIMWLQACAVPFLRQSELLKGNLGCLAANEKKTLETMNAINVKDLLALNVSLLLGLSASSLAFMVEMCLWKMTKRNSKKKSWK